jgi:4-hydroxyphenylacetate 3-monooxygenase
MSPEPVRLRVAGTSETLELAVGRLIIAGYTGSDVSHVKAHIEELAAAGIAPPPEVPMVYPVDWDLLTTGPAITVTGTGTSGEAEPVLARHAGAWYLGVGSDHTDRDLERESVHVSKKACPKPVAAEVIPLEADPASGGFDEAWQGIGLASQVDGEDYQRGTLADIRPPGDLLPRVLSGAAVPPEEDVVVFCGTVPILDGRFRPGRLFACQLSVPGHNSIGLRYTTGTGTAAAGAGTAG